MQKKPHKVAPDLWFDVGACKNDTDLREMVLFLFTLVSHWRFLRVCGMVYCIEDSQERQDRCWGGQMGFCSHPGKSGQVMVGLEESSYILKVELGLTSGFSLGYESPG